MTSARGGNVTPQRAGAEDVAAAKSLKAFDLRKEIGDVLEPGTGKAVGPAGKLSDFDFAVQLKDQSVRAPRRNLSLPRQGCSSCQQPAPFSTEAIWPRLPAPRARAHTPAAVVVRPSLGFTQGRTSPVGCPPPSPRYLVLEGAWFLTAHCCLMCSFCSCGRGPPTSNRRG